MKFFTIIFSLILSLFLLHPVEAATTSTVINKNETEYDAEFLQALQFGFESGITKFKTIDEFKPYDNVTREQAAKMIGQFALEIMNKKLDETRLCDFIDIKNADYSLVPHIIKSCKLTIMKGGADGYFLPLENLSKAQAITVIIRLFNNGLMNEGTTPRYRNYFEKAKELGLTKETQIESLERSLTRYELILLLYRFYVKNDLLNKYGNTFEMGNSAIKMIEEYIGTGGLKYGKGLVDTKQFLDQNISSVNINIFGTEYSIEKIKLVSQFTDAFTRYGDVYKNNEYIGIASFNIVKDILTDGTIRPLNTKENIYYSITMSSQPPYYDIKEIIQTTLNQDVNETPTIGTSLTGISLTGN